MNIHEDILRYNLRNVYFLIGTACGGKTTMADAIAKKYGFVHFNDNYHTDNFMIWQKIHDERYKDIAPQEPDWEHHFNRSPEIYTETLDKGYMEYAEYALLEIIKIARDGIVVADMNLPCELTRQLAPHNRIACLLAPPELVLRDYYGRDDHRDIYECIMSLKDPEKAFKNMEGVFTYGINNVIDDVRKSGLFYLTRNENSSVETTLESLEKHFQL